MKECDLLTAPEHAATALYVLCTAVVFCDMKRTWTVNSCKRQTFMEKSANFSNCSNNASEKDSKPVMLIVTYDGVVASRPTGNDR